MTNHLSEMLLRNWSRERQMIQKFEDETTAIRTSMRPYEEELAALQERYDIPKNASRLENLAEDLREAKWYARILAATCLLHKICEILKPDGTTQEDICEWLLAEHGIRVYHTTDIRLTDLDHTLQGFVESEKDLGYLDSQLFEYRKNDTEQTTSLTYQCQPDNTQAILVFPNAVLDELHETIKRLKEKAGQATSVPEPENRTDELPAYLTCPMSLDEAHQMADKNDGCIKGILTVSLPELIRCDVEQLDDLLNNRLIEDACLGDIRYHIIGHTPTSVFLQVTAELNDDD